MVLMAKSVVTDLFVVAARRAAEKIREESKGRFCVDCRYYSGDCSRITELPEWVVHVYTSSAVACKNFEDNGSRSKSR